MVKDSFSNKILRTFAKLKVRPLDATALLQFLKPLKEKGTVIKFHYEHSVRVAFLARNIAKFLNLDQKALFFSGLLHDLGKSEIPAAVLGKTEGWTEKDMQSVKKHVIMGYDKIKGRFDFTAEIILLHHRFQKSGYPEKLPPYLHDYSPTTQRAIYEYARLLSLADVFDALHRQNAKFGPKPLSDAEIKSKMLELHPDKKSLITDLYAAKIF